MVATMIKLDLLEKLDKSKIKNTENMLPALQNPPYDPSGDYSVVYTWGVTGIAYNTNTSKIRPAHGMICGKTNTKAVSSCSMTTVKSSAWDSKRRAFRKLERSKRSHTGR